MQRRNAEGRERIGCDDPWRDRSREALTQEWTERIHFPALDVSRRPVVQQREARDLCSRLADSDRAAEPIAAGEIKTHLEFEIQSFAWTETRWRAGCSGW